MLCLAADCSIEIPDSGEVRPIKMTAKIVNTKDRRTASKIPSNEGA